MLPILPTAIRLTRHPSISPFIYTRSKKLSAIKIMTARSIKSCVKRYSSVLRERTHSLPLLKIVLSLLNQRRRSNRFILRCDNSIATFSNLFYIYSNWRVVPRACMKSRGFLRTYTTSQIGDGRSPCRTK